MRGNRKQGWNVCETEREKEDEVKKNQKRQEMETMKTITRRARRGETEPSDVDERGN